MATCKLNSYQRDEIYRLTKERVEANRKAIGSDPTQTGGCLQYAFHGYEVMKNYIGAPRPVIQAGSASFLRIKPGMDDGMMATHFSYKWSIAAGIEWWQNHIQNQAQKGGMQGEWSLPEIHVWLGCPETGEIIDFSTGEIAGLVKSLTGLDWLADPLPPYLWAPVGKLSIAARYEPCRAAMTLVAMLLRMQGHEYP